MRQNRRRGAIILCGGKSTRMGTAKALLPFGPELMLQRVVRLVSEVVPLENVVVVAAQGQALPELPENVLIARDARDERGPLEGLAAGLVALSDKEALSGKVDAVYATSCDVPLLVPAFVERMFELMGEHDIAVPHDGKFHHPLAAVYRVSVLAHVRQLLADDRLRPFFLFERVETLKIPAAQLLDVDPELSTLMNCNDAEDYQRALSLADFGL